MRASIGLGKLKKWFAVSMHSRGKVWRMCGDEVDELPRFSGVVQTGSGVTVKARLGPGLAAAGPRGLATQVWMCRARLMAKAACASVKRLMYMVKRVTLCETSEAESADTAMFDSKKQSRTVGP